MNTSWQLKIADASRFTSTFHLTPNVPAVSRNAAIALFVVLLHVGLLWVLYSGLLVRTMEVFVPATVLSQLIEPPKPKVEPPAPAPPPPSPQRAAAAPPPVEVKKASPKTPPVLPPLPKAIIDPTPAPNAPTGAVTPQPAPAPVAVASPTPAPVAPAAPAAPAALPPSTAVQQPSSDADYLQNPKPPYPPISRRLNEQGTSVVRVLVGADGTPQSAEISKSSGFARLDSAAVATALRWRYVPGKRGGVAEPMSVNVPIVWVLD